MGGQEGVAWVGAIPSIETEVELLYLQYSIETTTVNMLGQDKLTMTFHAALLVLPSGIIYPAVDHHEFKGQQNTACESRPCYL